MRKLGKETYESNLKFNAILNQKQEVYTLAKVLARELVHDLKDLRNFVKPNEKVVKVKVHLIMYHVCTTRDFFFILILYSGIILKHMKEKHVHTKTKIISFLGPT